MTTKKTNDDIPSEHSRTTSKENKEPKFKMVAEQGAENINIHHPSSDSSSTSWRPLMSTSHCHLHRDPHELPDDIWLTPSGALWPEDIGVQSYQLRSPHGERPRLPPGLAVPILASASTSQPSWTSTSRQSGVVVATTATATATPATSTPTSRLLRALHAAAAASLAVATSLKTSEETRGVQQSVPVPSGSSFGQCQTPP